MPINGVKNLSPFKISIQKSICETINRSGRNQSSDDEGKGEESGWISFHINICEYLVQDNPDGIGEADLQTAISDFFCLMKMEKSWNDKCDSTVGQAYTGYCHNKILAA